jgi:hypothetical protein
MPLERSDERSQPAIKRKAKDWYDELPRLARKETPFTFRIRDCSGIFRRRYSGKPGPKGRP